MRMKASSVTDRNSEFEVKKQRAAGYWFGPEMTFMTPFMASLACFYPLFMLRRRAADLAAWYSPD